MTKKFRPAGWENPYQMLGWADLTRFVAQITAGKVMDRGIQQALEKAYEEGADAMLEILRYYPAGPLLCKFPGCQEQSLIYCYCQEHYRQLNRVT